MDGEAVHLTTACRCPYLYMRMQPSMHVITAGGGCFYLKKSMTKIVQHGLPPAIFHSRVTYVPPTFVMTPVPVWKCWGVCAPHRCESFNTELLVCTDVVSALYQHVFIFHGQYNGIHGWESIQTCVGNTLMAANPLLFCSQDFMWTNWLC